MKIMRNTFHSAPRHESGSAYVIALFVILLLTMLGLSLAFVTGTESLIGSTEEYVEQAFSAADAGIGIAAARILVDKECVDESGDPLRDASFIMSTEPGKLTQIETTLLHTQTLSVVPCNLCEVGLEDGRPKYNRTQVLISSIGRRASLRTRGDQASTTHTQRLVSTIIDIQPFEVTIDNCIQSLERYDDGENKVDSLPPGGPG